MAIPGIHVLKGYISYCTSVTVCGLFGCWGDIVTGLSRSSWVPQMADLSTVQSVLRHQRERTYKQY